MSYLLYMKYSSVVRSDRVRLADEVFDYLIIHKSSEYQSYPMSFYTKDIAEIIENFDILKDIEDKKNVCRSLFDINYKDFKRFSVDKTTKPATYKCIVERPI